jgi:MFS transporter, ACS family, glucarate transporter
MRYQDRVVGMLSLLSIITYIDRVCIAVAAFLSLAYAGILLQQPNLCAVCLDTGKAHAGAVFGFMNTAANLASSVSAVVFGYLVSSTGGYHAPFIPMLALLCVGAGLWFKLDPSRQIFLEMAKTVPAAAVESAV